MRIATALAAAAMVAAASAAAALASPVRPPEMPGPAPRDRSTEAAAVLNAGCERCHADIAAEWRESLHRRAFVEPTFTQAFATEPLAFCQGCHAPEADAKRAPPPWARENGVACVSCHVVAGKILAAPAAAPSKSAPHAVVRDARFGGDGACASCHEFEFPDARFRRAPLFMQRTMSEHQLSGARDQSCASCHMPLERGHRSHRFAASRDPAVVRSAAIVRAERVAPTRVRVHIEPAAAGHAFPTGNLFRRLAVSAVARDAQGRAVASSRRFLGRDFVSAQEVAGIVVRVERRDDRPFAHGNAASVVELELGPPAAGAKVVYRVVYQRVQHPHGNDPRDATVAGEIDVAAGELPP